MTNTAQFLEFISLIRKGSPSVFNDELLIEFDCDIDQVAVESLLSELGYELDSVKTVRPKKLVISLTAEYWRSRCPIFTDWKALFGRVSNSLLIPDVYYVIDGDVSSFDKVKQTKQLEILSYTRNLLADLADHCEPKVGPSRGSNKVVYIVENESTISKHEFSPRVDLEVVDSVSNIDVALDAVQQLTKAINVGDSQDKERANVMKSAFSEMIVGCSDEESIFPTIIRSLPEFHKKYEEHHELFVKRFSVNKLLQEISEQDLNYTSKINEIVSGAQNKALTIPGALIAIGAIMKIDHVADAIAVLVGMLMTTIIVHRSLNVHQATISHLEKQVDSDFQRYDTLNEKAEVRTQAKSTKLALSGLLSKATKNSTFMRISVWGIFFAAVLFLTFSAFNIKVTSVDNTGNTSNSANGTSSVTASELSIENTNSLGKGARF